MGSAVNIIGARSRNYLMNGDMSVRQRYGFFTNTITTARQILVPDRWRMSINNAGFFSASTAGPTTVTHPTTGLQRRAVNFNSTPSSASGQGIVDQRIESIYSQELVGKFASLSFLLRNNNFTTVNINLYYPTAQDNWGASTLFYTGTPQVLTADGVVKYVQFPNISMPAGIANGLMVEIVYSNFVNLGVNNDTALTDVMLNEGNGPIPFALFGGGDATAETQVCQRYFEVGVTQGRHDLNAPAAATIGSQVSFNSMKRAAPAMTFTDNSSGDWTTGVGSGGASVHGFAWNKNTGSGGTTPRTLNFVWVANAEL